MIEIASLLLLALLLLSSCDLTPAPGQPTVTPPILATLPASPAPLPSVTSPLVEQATATSPAPTATLPLSLPTEQPLTSLPPRDNDDPNATLTPPDPTKAATPAAIVGFDALRAKAHVDYLAGTLGRRPLGSSKLTQAASYIVAQFQSYGYSTVITQPISNGDAAGNVIAVAPAAEATSDAPILIFSAHYDSVAAGPGAVDNASGTALVLELARVLRQRYPQDELRFIAFTGEEAGLKGSLYYANSLSESERSRLIGVINLDSAAAGKRLVVVGNAKLSALAIAQAQTLGLILFDFNRFNLGSDHLPFVQISLPAITLGRWLDAGYHSAGDLPERVSLPGLTLMAGLAISVADALVQGEAGPN